MQVLEKLFRPLVTVKLPSACAASLIQACAFLMIRQQRRDLAPDGKRFVVILYADGTAEPMTQLTVLLHFFDELRRRVPAGGK